MESPFQFSTFRRDQLIKVLRKHGCYYSVEVAIQMEELAREYGKTSWLNRHLAIETLDEAGRILDQADAAADALDYINADNLRRFERECQRREKPLSFDRYRQRANEISSVACYAVEKAVELVWNSQEWLDQEFRRLVAGLEGLWVRNVGGCLPELPNTEKYPNETWKHQRALERHPIWIILTGLGMKLRASSLMVAISAARNDPGVTGPSTSDS